MAWESMHDIEVVHRWQEVDRIERLGYPLEIINRCHDCLEKGGVFVLDATADRGTSSNDLSRIEERVDLGRVGEMSRRLGYQMDRIIREILDHTEYDEIQDVVDEFNKRYPSRIRADEVPLRHLRSWVATGNKAFKRKLLLVQKQGPVCNRCDSIVRVWNDLTEDHIRPVSKGGGGELTNLQLLCGRCNQEKGDNCPGKRDISPFSDYGQQCLHRITCVELSDLGQAHKENKRPSTQERYSA